MTVPPLARAVAKALADEPLDVPPPNEARRTETVLALRAELALRQKRRERKRWGTIAVAAAALLLASGGGWAVSSRLTSGVATRPSASAPPDPRALAIVADEVHGAVFVTTANGTSPLDPHAELLADQGVVTGDGDVTLALGTAGTRVKIDPRSSASLRNGPDAGLVRVKSGAVTAMVAKLKPNERFLIQTDEAEVEAHGTVFTVARTTTAECGARTSVHVVEGRISVRDKGGTLFLHAAEDWKSLCAPAAPAPSEIPSAPPRPTTTTTPTTTATPTPTTTTSTSTPTTTTTAMTSTTSTPTTTAATTTAPSAAPYPEFGRRK